jgi:peptidoglycan-associated lipoprotein
MSVDPKEEFFVKSPLYKSALLGVLLAAIVVFGANCSKKKVTPPTATSRTETAAPVATSHPAPTISLSASPSTIERGQSATITWSTSNATTVTIDGGIGTVEASGNRSVSPAASTTYSAKASGPGGTANAETRVTVTPPTGGTTSSTLTITDMEFFTTYIKDVFFDFDSFDLREDARQVLREDARALAERPKIQVVVEGHCDERGSESYNLALGDKRANVAKEFLVGQGISQDRIETISYGEERPFALGHDEAAWAQNRRAHFVQK